MAASGRALPENGFTQFLQKRIAMHEAQNPRRHKAGAGGRMGRRLIRAAMAL